MIRILSSFSEPAKLRHPAFRYGLLAIVLSLLVRDIWWRATLPPSYPYSRYGNCVVAIMLLLNHLAFQFRWRTPVTVALRVAAWVWIVFGCCYLFYWSTRM